MSEAIINPEEELEQLRKENKRLLKRLDRITDQGDRQHKQIEKFNEHLQSYIDIIDDHIITVSIDQDTVIKSVSTAFSNAYGYTADEVKGKNYDFILDKEYVERFSVELHDIKASKQPWHGELKHITKADSVMWTETIVTPQYDENNEEIIEYTLISKNITQEKQLKELKAKKLSEKEYDQSMLEYMGSKSSALLQRAARSFSYVLWLLFAAIAWFLLWANNTEIDELARGKGTIIPTMQTQRVQSFDGGRIEKIFIKEGMIVKKGDLLFKLNEIESASSYAQNSARLYELKVKQVRLIAEASDTVFAPSKELIIKVPELVKHEHSLYLSNVKQRNSKIQSLREKKNQHESSLLEAKEKFKRLHENFNFLDQEMIIKQGLMEDKIISKVEYLQLNRQRNELLLEINSVEKEITKLESSISEVNSNIQVNRLDFINVAKKELNSIYSEIDRLEKSGFSLSDQVNRTAIFSPVDGTVNKINVTTQGEVVRSGAILAEIIPLEDHLIIEANIQPEDIAFLKLNQESIVKLSAYDFSIYGGLKAKIVYISADTIKDEEDGKNYYVVHLQAEKNYLGSAEKPLYVKVGMVTDVDILLGKKTVMDYILKPIMKAKQTALSER